MIDLLKSFVEGRICTKCRTFKTKEHFSNSKGKYRGGIYSWCKECHSLYSKERRSKNKEFFLASEAERRKNIRTEVLFHYGGNPPKCNCCGESIIEFLCIDHVDGGGNKHRKQISLIGSNFYFWLKRNGFPKGYQVLCHNCNMAKGFYGRCPHENNERNQM